MVCATTLDAGAARPPLIGVLRVPPCGVLGHSSVPTRSSAVRQFPTSLMFIDFHPIARAKD
jgi:hypothetical protein